MFNRAWFEIVDAIPPRGRECRYWDFAATERKSAGDDPDYTAAVRVYAAPDGTYYVTDCIEEQMGPAEGERLFMAYSRKTRSPLVSGTLPIAAAGR